MPYVQLDDGFCDHPKVRGLSDSAFRLHVASIAHSSRFLTDGIVLSRSVPDLVRRYRSAALAELVTAGLWRPLSTIGYEIVGYLDWNDSRAVVEERRARKAERQARWLEKANAAKGDK